LTETSKWRVKQGSR